MADHSDSEDVIEFASGDSGASATFPMQCSALRKNGFVVIKDRPCKIVEMSTSKTGKHGSAKVNLVGIDIFNGKKYEDISPSTANMMVPHVVKKEYVLMDISDDGYTSLFDEDKNENRDDIKLPAGDLGNEIKEKFENDETLRLAVVKALGEEHILSYKVETDKK